MKFKARRITALILALCMLVGFMPTAPAGMTAGAAPADFSIDLSKAWVSGNGDYQAVAAKIDTHGWEINEEMTVANYYGAGNGGRAQDSNNMNLASSGFNIMFGLRSTANNLTLNIKAPAAGAYKLKLNALHHSYGATVAVFVNQKYMGIVNTNTGTTWTTTPLHSVELTAGVNTITFMRMSGKTQLLLKDIIFEGIETVPTFDKMSVEDENGETQKVTVKVGDTLKVKAGALMSDGNYKFINGYKYIGVSQISTGSKDTSNTGALTSSNTDVATVALDTTASTAGQNFYGEIDYVMTALSTGTTFLTFTGKIDGVDKSGFLEVEVVDEIVPEPSQAEDITLDFCSEWIKAGGTGGNTLPITQTLATDGWQINKDMTHPDIYGVNNNNNLNNPGNGAVRMQSIGLDLRLKTNVDSSANDFTLDVNAKAGAYRMSAKFMHLASGSGVAVFVNKEFMGYIATNSGSGDIVAPLNCVMLKDGANQITLRRVGGNVQTVLKSIEFKALEEMPTVKDLYIKADEETIQKGDTTNVEYWLRMSDDLPYELNGYLYAGGKDLVNNTISIVSSEPAVGTIGVAGSPGKPKMSSVFTALEKGNTTITATAKLGNETRSASVNMTVEAEALIPTLTIKDKYTVVKDVDTELQIFAAMDEKYTDLSNATITASAVDDSVADVSVRISEDKGHAYLVIKGKKTGTTDIDIKGVFEGASQDASAKMTLAVAEKKPESFEIDFNSYNPTSANDKLAITQTLKNDGWEVNVGMTDETIWANNGARSGNFVRLAGGGMDVRPASYDTQRTSDITLNVNIPETGAYSPVVEYLRFSAKYGAQVAVFIDKEYVGRYNCSQVGSETSASTVMNSVYLEAGTHQFTFRKIDSKVQFYVSKLIMNGIDAVPVVEGIAVEGNKNLSVGESTTLRPYIELSDGVELNVGKLFAGGDDENTKIICENETTDILQTVSDNKFKALTSGTGNISYSTIVGTEPYSMTQDIEVDDKVIDKVELALSNPELSWNDTANISVAAFIGDKQVSDDDLSVKLSVDDGKILSLTGRSVKAIKAGNTWLRAEVKLGNTTINEAIEVHVKSKVEIAAIENCRVALDGSSKYLLDIKVDGEQYDVGDTGINLQFEDPSVAEGMIQLSEDLNRAYIVLSGKVDKAQSNVTVSMTVNNVTGSVTIPFIVTSSMELYRFDVALEDSTLQVGETGKVNLTAYGVDGSQIKDIQVYYEVSDAKIAVVANDGTVTARNAGSVTITAHVAKDSIKLSKSVTLNVGGASDIDSVTLSGAATVTLGGSAQMTVSGKLFNGFAADLSSAQIVYSEVANDGVIELDTAKGIVKGVAEGMATIKATVTTASGSYVTNEKTITVRQSVEPVPEPDPVPGDVMFDFTINQTGYPMNALISSHGWQVDTENTDPALVSGSAIFRYQGYGFDVRPSAVDTKKTADVALTIYIPADGVYKPEVKYFIYSSGKAVAVFCDGVYLGSYDSKAGTNGAYGIVELNSISLDKGNHTLTFRALDNKAQLFVTSVNFRLQENMPVFDKVVAEADKSVMSVGETATLSAGVLMSDGTYLNMGKSFEGGNDDENSINISSRNTSVLTISGNTIKAVGAGNGIIDVEVDFGGNHSSYPIYITVDNQKLSSVSAVTDTTLYPGVTANLVVTGYTPDMRKISAKDLRVSVSCNSTSVVSVSGTTIKGVSVGTQKITVSATLNGKTVSADVNITVMPTVLSKVTVTSETVTVMKPDAAGVQLKISAADNMGQDFGGVSAVTWSSSDDGIASVDENGFVTPHSVGVVVITASVQTDNGIIEGDVEITVTNGKTSSSFYTAEKVKNARENIKKYDWARTLKNTAVSTADNKYDYTFDEMWNRVTTQELPRSMGVGFWDDPEWTYCRFCGVDMRTITASYYPWLMDPDNSPWKVQCRACRRQFPTNDFGSFYQLGIDEHGNWRYEQAHRKHYELFADEYAQKGVSSYEQYSNMRASGARLPGVGYLKNDKYPEVASFATVNGGRGLGATETADTWGVDDGYGYKTGHTYDTAYGIIEEAHTYIAYYNHYGVWFGTNGGSRNSGIVAAMTAIRDAYLYTGDIKYGRLGAILIDRIADVYPDMNILNYNKTFRLNGSKTWPRGKVFGSIHENEFANPAALLYDAVYDCFDDPQVVSYLSSKAAQYNMENDKSTARKIRENIEDNLLREIRDSVIVRNNNGNFGMHQSSMAYAAVVLDSQPETGEMVDWIFNNTDNDYEQINVPIEGGNVARKLINGVNRDGGGEEGSVAYNMLWIERLKLMADALVDYPDETKNLYQNPRYIKMFTAFAPMILCRRTLLQMGDAGSVADVSIGFTKDTLMDAYVNSGDKTIGQLLYFVNGNTTEGLHSSIFSADAEKVKDDVEKLIEAEGEYPFDSEMLTGYGFGILRDGDLYESVSGTVDTQRDFWIGFGQGAHHGHLDSLNLGIHAYGLDMAPEFGYPGVADGSAFYYNWGKNNLSHNTVMVNATQMTGLPPQTTGLPKHFDDSGRVKVMDISDLRGWTRQADVSDFRRTVVMIEASDEVSYGVDFFRVRGGNDHIYAFHALSQEATTSDNLKFIEQPMGTYAGVDVPYGSVKTLYANGFDYLTDVRRAQYPNADEFTVDFKIKDFRNTLKNPNLDLHLKMTMLNDFAPTEVALAHGAPAQYRKNPEYLEFVLVRRQSNSSIDSLFTTVFEPYNGASYIEKQEQVPMDIIGGTPQPNDTAKAVKITFKNGRVDYVVYATNNKVAYNVDGLFDFRGFVAVYTLENGKPVYTYLNDGDLLGGNKYTAAYSGTVTGFTKDIVRDNYITVEFDNSEIDLENVIGKYIYIDNGDVTKNGVYEITDAKNISGNTYELYIGQTTLVRQINSDMSYTHNIAEGQSFTIPIASVNDNAPVFTSVENKYSATAGKKISVNVLADSPLGKEITYTATNLPRGASFNAEIGVLTWTPDNTQIGENIVSITASDGVLETTAHFTVEVYKAVGSTTDNNSPSDNGSTDTDDDTDTDTDTPSGTTPGENNGSGSGAGAGSGSAGGGASGGGASGGGSGSAPSGDDSTDKDENKTDEEVTPSVPSEKFIDLGNHTWAKDAIYSLVDAGVVNGTSHNTYSPGKDITRADFTVLLVRAFGLESESSENFADVSSNAYYAKELAIAKAHGIVNGVGGNKYNPTATITRQDMMTIVSRALKKLGYELEAAGADALADYADGANVSDYATEHVANLIANEIVKGSNGRINPASNTTRAEVAVLIERLINLKK